jgi:hypothetical protein
VKTSLRYIFASGSVDRRGFRKRSCSGRFATRCLSGRNSLTLNARLTGCWRSGSRLRISPSAAHHPGYAHICHNEDLGRRVRQPSVQELLISFLRDGRTGQREEHLCSGGQTSTDPPSNQEGRSYSHLPSTSRGSMPVSD